MTDIADTALRRIGRDLRLALPNSVRVDPSGRFIEFLPTTGGGRYRAADAGTTYCAAAAPTNGDALIFSAADTCFEVLGPMPAVNVGDQIVMYNLGITGADAYAGAGNNRRAVSAPLGTNSINITSASALPFDSPSHRFQVITTPVSYVCAPVANGVGGTLTRYWGYAIQPGQPTTVATLNGLAGVKSAQIATNVSSCSFSYSAFVVAQRSGLVTMNLGITENNNETVSLYSATHVSNQP
jgi:MSHA biogenesis protein MshO